MNSTLEPQELIIADVSQAFLHAEIDDEVFVQPPSEVDGIKICVGEEEITLDSSKVWRLRNALYGYRKAPKLWQ